MGLPWKPLKPGDVVDVIAPGYGVKQADIDKTKDYITSLGLVPRIPDNMCGDDLLSANDEETRIQLAKQALFSSDSSAVWAIKGGYGTGRIIPALNDIPPPNQTKLLIGFSDITALHCLAIRRWQWHTLHAPVLWQIVNNRVDRKTIKAVEDVILGRKEEVTYTLEPLNNRRPSSYMQSRVVGGNMMLLQNSVSTCWEANVDDAILFLEDIDESPYRVARVLTHLEQAGWFKRATALIIGDFSFIERKDDAEKLDKVLHEHATLIPIPTFRLSGIGHEKRNMPLPLNTQSALEINSGKATLTCHSGYASGY